MMVIGYNVYDFFLKDVVLNAQLGFRVDILNVDVTQFFMISNFVIQHIICPQIEKECE
jgi:hypothetical protein